MKDNDTTARDQWSGRIGFILAAAGSAIGLGNIWGFPYKTGVNGGGLFVLIYLFCILFIGLPVVIAEIMIGRNTQKSPIAAFAQYSSKRSPWCLVGVLGVVCSVVIMSYYSMIAGWTLNYCFKSLFRCFDGKNFQEVTQLFKNLQGTTWEQLIWHIVFMGMTVGILYGGIKNGIEKWSKILMPILFLLMIGLVLYSFIFLFQGTVQSLRFTFLPKGPLKPEAIFKAVGQAFFTLSLGMGTMLTYGSYLDKKSDIPKASVWICGLDTFIALIACVVVFPIIFQNNAEPTGGPGLVFESLPVLFNTIPGGMFFGAAFFLLLVFAALTSAISITEVSIAFVIDHFHFSRKKMSIIIGILVCLAGFPCIHQTYFGWMEYLTDLALPLGGIFISLFVGWKMPKKVTFEEFTIGNNLAKMYPVWLFLVRVFIPIILTIFMLNMFNIIPTESINAFFGFGN